jgi:DNA-binding CsgD family transcriptional regulator/tetratricopeptide (TPR) repeat protein
MAHVLAWAVEHDLDAAARMVTALGVWWVLRGRLAGQGPLLRELARRAGPGSVGWCAAQFWLAWTAFGAADLPQALQRSAAIIEATGDREPSRLVADCLTVQSETLANLGRIPEAAECGRRALALARELDYPFAIARATACLVLAALYAGDLDEAVQLARQAGQIPDVPGTAGRLCGFLLAATLAEAGDLAGAGQAGAVVLAWARDAGDAYSLDGLLTVMADLDLRAGRAADAAGRLREAVHLMLSSGEWFMMVGVLERCGQLCAATGRPADAVTAWAAMETLMQQGGLRNPGDSDVPRRQDALRAAGRVLGPDRVRAAEQRGKVMSLATAAEYALMLTGPGSPQHAGTALPGKLSARERELVTLVAQGRTDAQIAAQLFISIRTVRSHLDRIRDKTGCRRRADLTRLAPGRRPSLAPVGSPTPAAAAAGKG